MPTISIIVPIYNVQDYLKQCLDSLFSQYENDWEVILVDDGSTDQSLLICQEYYSKYPNIIKIIHKNNGGLSDARNVGTEIATGNYIYYLDSDDWIVPGAVQQLYSFAIKNNCDIVQGSFYYAYEKYLLYDNRYFNANLKSFVLDRRRAMLELIQQHYIKNFAWGKLYKTEIVKKIPFLKGKYFEDSYWQHLIINEVNNYGVVTTPLYYYRQRTTGISGVFSLKNMDLLRGYEERLLFINKDYPEFMNVMVKIFWHQLFQFYEIARRSSDVKLKECFIGYYNEVMIDYKELFDKVLNNDISYKYRNKRYILKLYTLEQKLYHRFDKRLKKINLC